MFRNTLFHYVFTPGFGSTKLTVIICLLPYSPIELYICEEYQKYCFAYIYLRVIFLNASNIRYATETLVIRLYLISIYIEKIIT